VLRCRRDRRLQLLDRGAQGVDLVLEPLHVLVTLLRLLSGPSRGLVLGLDREVARAQLPTAVALFGDVATEQLARADVDRVIGEELVEDVRSRLRSVFRDASDTESVHLVEV